MTTHVMLDLETLSTRKNAAIIQIAAVQFNPLDGNIAQVSQLARFNAFVRSQSHDQAHIDVSTVAWWMQQKPAASLGKKIETNGVSLLEALSTFTMWLKALGPVEAVWSHGATFDIAIVEYHCAVLGVPVPWHYRAPRDTRTLFALAPGGMPKVEQDPNQTHDALYDCQIQIKQVVGALAALRAQANAAAVAQFGGVLVA